MHECERCGVVFFDRELFKVHEYGNYYDYTDDWDEARVAWEVKIRKRALSSQIKQFSAYVKGRELLDIGAGPGYLCHLANSLGWNARAVEVSEKALRIGQKFLGVEYLTLDDVADESLDVITCYHILEHMERPDGFLKKIHGKLKSDGVIAVHVPHREPLSFALRNKISALQNNRGEKHCQLYLPEHISGFTAESLVNTLQLYDFDPLFVKTSAMWGTYYDPFFVQTFLKDRNYVGMFKHTLRSLVDNLGVLMGQGDWVVGHFRKRAKTTSG
jgi:SAM-dependent methyltransferase